MATSFKEQPSVNGDKCCLFVVLIVCCVGVALAGTMVAIILAPSILSVEIGVPIVIIGVVGAIAIGIYTFAFAWTPDRARSLPV